MSLIFTVDIKILLVNNLIISISVFWVLKSVLIQVSPPNLNKWIPKSLYHLKELVIKEYQKKLLFLFCEEIKENAYRSYFHFIDEWLPGFMISLTNKFIIAIFFKKKTMLMISQKDVKLKRNYSREWKVRGLQ